MMDWLIIYRVCDGGFGLIMEVLRITLHNQPLLDREIHHAVD